MSRLRQKFIILNLQTDKDEERSKWILNQWHALRMFRAAVSDPTSYTDILKKMDEPAPTGPQNALEYFKMWVLSTPEWIDFELTREEVQRLANEKQL